MANLWKLISSLIRLSSRTRNARINVVLIIAMGVIGGLASTGLVALINASLHAEKPGGKLLALFVGLCIILPAARFLSNWLLLRLIQEMVYDLRVSLSRRILSAPLRKLEELGAHRLLAMMTDDVGTITGAMGNIPLLCLHLTVVAGCLVYLGWLSSVLLLVVLAFVLGGVLTYYLPVLRAQQHFRLNREQWDRMFAHFRGLTQGTKELKIHGPRREEFLGQHVERTAAALRRHAIAGNTIYSVANSWGQMLFFIAIGIVLFAFPGFGGADSGVASGYALAILYMATPLDVILNLLPGLGRASVALDKVRQLGLSLEEEQAEPEAALARHRKTSWSRLDLVGITHQYRHERDEEIFTLGPIELSVRPGELVFVVGGNGSGKTTLAKLLIGLYLPESGEIRLDGQTIDAAAIDAYRQRFSVVFTDFFLFEDLLGLASPDLDEQARDYLIRLQLERKVKIEGGTLSTVDLSQGQRKRLALLTAYLEDRPIYLFDEWAADQDPQFKEVFYLYLLPELKARGKTVFVISHDDRYYHVADRIVKLNYGRIEYDGDAAEYLGLASPVFPGAVSVSEAPDAVRPGS